MKIDPTNQAQSVLLPQGGGSTWSCYYDEPQKLSIKITSVEDEDERKVGLTQTLVSSSRIATYEDGGSLEITPSAGLPCLDADEETIPWYNGASAEVTLDHKQPQTLTMEDSPATHVPSYLLDPTGARKEINDLRVSENFLLTLYETQGDNFIKQWTWSYSYYVVKTGGSIYQKPTIQNHDETGFEPQEPVDSNIKLDGPVATEGSNRVLTQGWTEPD
ncbi:MAG: hypothetical protein M1813_004470 [Trichoglossum hirsutum]|jgi:hypothetical protein|nr:MAG: hypothetical protein M1813_004470 [Trichoglossum hirsutum]